MVKVSINLDEEVMNVLEKRAKKELLSPKDLAEDIVRRSLVSWKKRRGIRRIKVDDKLIAAFSRDRRGRKKK